MAGLTSTVSKCLLQKVPNSPAKIVRIAWSKGSIAVTTSLAQSRLSPLPLPFQPRCCCISAFKFVFSLFTSHYKSKIPPSFRPIDTILGRELIVLFIGPIQYSYHTYQQQGSSRGKHCQGGHFLIIKYMHSNNHIASAT
jgi:hypothetical protein